MLVRQRLGGLSYFAGAENKDERVLVPDLGSLTSIYDRFVCSSFASRIFLSVLAFEFQLTKLWHIICRARELFYYLKGGQVDYGEEHRKSCGHSQFGRTYEQGNYKLKNIVFLRFLS